MMDTERDIIQAVAEKGSRLADAAGESFVLAITAAYLAGKETGRKEALEEQAA
jgi:hypothetical protein